MSYVPDFTAQLSHEFKADHRRLRITPSLSYQTGYPYGNGKKIYVFDPITNKPIHVSNDNYENPGYNYYFLRDPSQPFNAAGNPYIGNLGTNEGADPNTLRSTPQMLVTLHLERDLSPRLTAVVDVANLFGNFSPTAYQGNPYLIGPPGYAGENALYGAAYQSAAGFAQLHAGQRRADERWCQAGRSMDVWAGRIRSPKLSDGPERPSSAALQHVTIGGRRSRSGVGLLSLHAHLHASTSSLLRKKAKTVTEPEN